MDSLTQIALGGAVGELLLGKKVGYRAALWGAALGTLPDLDVLANPFLDSVDQLYFHRNITHSIFFALAASPLIGWLIDKFHKHPEVGWTRWANLSFWVILTHILIDLPTSYGTQLFQPFSDYPATLDSIYIIDPLYTLPLLIGLISALFLRRDSVWRSRVNSAGLIISTLYMLSGLAIKTHVNSVYQESFTQAYGSYEDMKTTPNGPSVFLWSGYMIRQDTVYHSLYSVFDSSRDLEFQAIPRNSEYIGPYEDDRALEALLWFSRGYYSVEKNGPEDIILYDLRFGRADFWMSEDEEYVWGNQLEFDEDGKAHSFDMVIPPIDIRTGNLQLLWNRVWGYKPPDR